MTDHREPVPGWPDPDYAKKVLAASAASSGAAGDEFSAAMLGVLSTKVGPAVWAESCAQALACFRDGQFLTTGETT